MESGSERRREERRPVELEVDCEVDGAFLTANVRDISSLGMFIRTQQPLSVGARLMARFPVPGFAADRIGRRADDPLYLHGRVVWSTGARSDASDAGMGIEFVETSADDRKALLSLVEAIARHADTV